MALELPTLRSFFLPLFIRKDNEEPRKVHWVGSKEPAPISPGGNNPGQPPERTTKRGYRNLSGITLGEVSDAYKMFAGQLVPSPYPAWIAPNYFCMIDLAQPNEGRPPAVFGRVRNCFPGDGYIQNIQEMEISFPQMNGPPEIIQLRSRDISAQVQSYCLRVWFHGTTEDIADFQGMEDQFVHQGYSLAFHTNYLDFLELEEQDQGAVAQIHVISSRWYAAIPATIQFGVREKLARLVYRNPLIFNYHIERFPVPFRTLNKELGLKAGFTEISLLEPETPEQTLRIIQKQFDLHFAQAGIKSSRL